MPSHQMSPSSVSATLVKIELPLAMVRIAFGLVWKSVPGRDAEEAVLGVDRVEAGRPRRCGSRRCRRRSSRPSSPAGSARAWPGSSCRRPTGTRPRCSRPCSRARSAWRSACARPASPRRAPSPRRCAASSTSCPAARCRRSPSRTTRSAAPRGSARCTWCRCTATATSLLAGLERRADRVQAGHEGCSTPSSVNSSSALVPRRVMMCIEATT